MSKIICDVCGTSYPETAAQCPICGCVRPGDTHSVMGDTADNEANGAYTYVKGGRFSKSNVRKRNKSSGYDVASMQSAGDGNPEKKENKGLIITAIVLLLAIIAVVIYVGVQYFLPGSEGNEDTKPSAGAVQGTTDPKPVTVSCEKITLDVYSFTLDKENAARMIYATAEPADTTDHIIFSSSDDTVATVDANGKVTAVGSGQAVITVICGDIKAECTVSCTFQDPDNTDPTDPDPTDPPIELRLNRKEFSLFYAGDSWLLYDGDLGIDQITWSSDDETVVKVINGRVIAVGSGNTKVHAEYAGQKVSCIVHCSFKDDSQSGGTTGNVTEDGGTSGSVTEDGGSTTPPDGTYRLYNFYGNAEDVTIRVGESFTLRLVDSNGNAVDGVVWTVSNDAYCTVSDGHISGVSEGVATVTAEYNGKTYSCTVRIY